MGLKGEQKEVELMGLQEEEKTITFQGVERIGVHKKGLGSQKDRRTLGESLSWKALIAIVAGGSL